MRCVITAFACAMAVAGAFAHPADARPRGTIAILMPGGSGSPGPGKFLTRNHERFVRAGIRTETASSPGEAVSLSRSARAGRVTIVAMSRGVIRAAVALAHGARVSRVVFVSGNYNKVMSILGTPARLPPTLVVQNRYDRCPGTTPKHVEPFRRWARGKVRVHWANIKGRPVRNFIGRGARIGSPRPPDGCTPFAAHGFYGHDRPAMAAILAFIR